MAEPQKGSQQQPEEEKQEQPAQVSAPAAPAPAPAQAPAPATDAQVVAPAQQQPQAAPDAALVSQPSVKHPLMNKWTMWFDSPTGKTKQSDWGLSLKRIIDFEFVEDFWGTFNNIVAASKLALGSNYHVFKYGIEPKWEDVQNARGGKWVVMVPKKAASPQSLDDLWLNTLLSIIGEQFDQYSSEICGAVVSPRAKADRISLWTRTCSSSDAVQFIGARFKACLELPETSKIGYQYHQDSLSKGASFNNASRYEV